MNENEAGRPLEPPTTTTAPAPEGPAQGAYEAYEEEPEGGEPACWLHRLCPECDAVQDTERPERCWRCGARLAGSALGGDLT